MVVFNGVVKVKAGLIDEYIEELKKLEKIYRAQAGNVYYAIGRSISDNDVLCYMDCWEDEKAFKGHMESEEVAKTWFELFDKYVDTEIVGNQYEV